MGPTRNVRVGTSGFSYPDWVGPFYPPGLPSQEQLPYYSTYFETVELNFTFYKLPSEAQLELLARRVPEGFDFSVKAHRSLTHESRETYPSVRNFLLGFSPLAERGMLGAVLFQFPYSFHLNEENLKYLRYVGAESRGFPLVIEFRNREWWNDSVLSYLDEERLGVCCVDEPTLEGLIRPAPLVFGEIGYVRFHGKRSDVWWTGDRESRYDYTYSKEELQGWLPLIEEMEGKARRVYIYLNNHPRGQAVTNALEIKELLGQAGQQGAGGQGYLPF